MQAPNPYSTNTPDHSIEAETDIDKRHRLITAFSIGLSSCLIGPIFLWLFWIAHGLARGIIQTLSFFALIYVVPSLIAVVIGLLAGFVLSPMCPRIDGTKRWAITIGVAVVTNAIGIGLLLSGQLNFGTNLIAIELPAFSVACALASLTTTSAHLAIG